MRFLYQQIAPPGTFLVAATGWEVSTATTATPEQPPRLGGAVVGFTKTYKRERLDALVKAVDFEPKCTAAEIAENLIEGNRFTTRAR